LPDTPAQYGSDGKYLDAGLGVLTMESRMKSAEIVWNPSRRARGHHDHIVTLALDPIDWHRFRAGCEDLDDVTIIDARLDGPNRVVVQCGCSTAAIADRLADAWG